MNEQGMRHVSFFVAALFTMLTLTLAPAHALDDDEFGGYASDTLSIQVGYPGGPYYEKRLYTLSELEGMDVVYEDYTFIDNMPSVIIDHVKGVRLADIIDGAGIELGAVNRFHFWIQDKKESSYVTFSKASLIDTPRYCFYSLPDNFDYDEGEGNEYAGSDAQQVDTVMALADDWNRTIAGATFGSDFLNLNANTRFRLIFGQREPTARTASQSAKWVYAITAELSGTPTITLNVSEVALEAGSVLPLVATVTAADPLVAELEPVMWTSSDERVAAVDEKGSVTAQAVGSTVITAEFHGVLATAVVNVTAAAAGEASGGKAGGKGGAATSGRGSQARPSASPANTPGAEGKVEDAIGEGPPEPSAQPSYPPESTPQESAPPEPLSANQPPESEDADTERSVLPIIGASAMVLFVVGGLVVQLVSRDRARGAKKPPEG